jgi:TPR repeat protein/ATP-dependent protease ClpP protease subunit
MTQLLIFIFAIFTFSCSDIFACSINKSTIKSKLILEKALRLTKDGQKSYREESFKESRELHKEAHKYYLEAAKLNDSFAQLKLGESFDGGRDGVRGRSTEKAIPWLIKSAKQGCIKASYKLAKIYKHHPSFKNKTLASKWIQPSLKHANANSHEPEYQYTLGVIYSNGYLGEEDITLAKYWYSMAANKGHASAQNNLGMLLKDEGDFAGALKWWRLAAKQNSSSAKNNLQYAISNRDYTIANSHSVVSGFFKVTSDIKVNKLRIKLVTNYLDNTCKSGQSEHIELIGEINDDSSYIVDKLLSNLIVCEPIGVMEDKRPIVYLNSQGGLLKDGYLLGDIFNKYGAHVIVPDGVSCASSCAISFLGGIKKTMFRTGRLIFHAPYNLSPTGVEQCYSKSQSKELMSYFQGKIGAKSGKILFQRTMGFCGSNSGWVINSDTAKVYNLI